MAYGIFYAQCEITKKNGRLPSVEDAIKLAEQRFDKCSQDPCEMFHTLADAQAASGDRIWLDPTGDRALTCVLSHDLKIAKNILENDLLPPSQFDPDWPKEHEIEKRKYVRVEVWVDHKIIGWADDTNGSYETV